MDSRTIMELGKAVNQNDNVKAVNIMKGEGWSNKLISRVLKIPENEVRYLVRRE